jgi:cytochrome c oxidase assembly protein subunit 15
MNKNRIVGRWLLLGVFMLMVQVLLGGVTRLTGSGLSITEWKPLLGALPPLNETEWLHLFDKYKQIAQFKYLNQDFTLSDFKFIFFWEWLHRNWARLISVAFLGPFIYFLYKKIITKEMVPKLMGLFILGAGQGLIGWIMVASGLNNEDNLYVSHIRLAIHFISALVLIAFTYWFALSLLVTEKDQIRNRSLNKYTWGVMGLLAVQLVYGAFMAGLKAATVAPTWPSINGDTIPAGLWQQSFVHHPINIHFIHRMLAYLLFGFVCLWYWKARSHSSSTLFSTYRFVPLALVLVQLTLGILTVLNASHLTRNGLGLFEYLALFHQIVAMCLVMSFVWVLYVLNKKGLTENFNL